VLGHEWPKGNFVAVTETGFDVDEVSIAAAEVVFGTGVAIAKVG
jgi:hypothetical protein